MLQEPKLSSTLVEQAPGGNRVAREAEEIRNEAARDNGGLGDVEDLLLVGA
jgi:hypothetical protein